MKNKLPYIVFLTLSFIITILYTFLAFFQKFDNVFYDFYQRAFPLNIKNPVVVFINIDQKSLDFLKENSYIAWPWPRSVYKTLIDALNDAKAKHILIDLIFSSPSIYGRADDSIFQDAIEKSNNVYLPFISGSGKTIQDGEIKYMGFKIPKKYADKCIKAERLSLPISMFQKAVRGMGDGRGFPDKDGIFREYPVCTKVNNVVFPSFAFSIYPFDSILSVLKRYKSSFLYPRFPRPETFKSYSFVDIISLYKKGKLHNLFSKKTVIVGATAPGLLDLRPTSINKNTPGMYLHGIILENMRRNAFVRHFAAVPTIILILSILLLFYFLYFLDFPLWIRSIAILGFIFILTGLSMVLFNRASIFISPILILIPPILSYIMFISYDYITKDKERRFVKKLFKFYVSPELLEEILHSPELIKLGGEKKLVTIMFSDIASFTTLSEKLEPEKVVEILNTMLEEMSSIIIEERGYIDKYEGDAIMALWNAPGKDVNHATHALNAAIKCKNVLKNKINPELEKRGFGPLFMRFGINSGDAVVGNIGSMKRFDYTAIGDNVNLASRLEGINKVYGTSIIASEFTKREAEKESPQRFVFRELDLVRVKGKEKPVKIYEILGFSDSVDNRTLEIIKLYERALYLYRKGAFKDAKNILIKIKDKDKPSEALLERCLYLIENPPLKWDGVFTMKTK